MSTVKHPRVCLCAYGGKPLSEVVHALMIRRPDRRLKIRRSPLGVPQGGSPWTPPRGSPREIPQRGSPREPPCPGSPPIVSPHPPFRGGHPGVGPWVDSHRILQFYVFFKGPETMLDRSGLKKYSNPSWFKPNRMAGRKTGYDHFLLGPDEGPRVISRFLAFARSVFGLMA